MGFRVSWVRYGRVAAEALRVAISDAKAGDPLAPVTVVVPSNSVGVAARRQLASGRVGAVCERGSGVAAVTFVTVYRLAELLGAAALAGDGRRPVSTPVVAAAVRAALAADPGVFEAVAEHPATETALVAAYRELRDVSRPSVDALAGAGRRAADVVRLCDTARDRLAAAWYDEEDLMAAATSAVPAGGGAATDVGQLIVHLPQRLSRHAASLLRALADRQPDDVAVIAGTTGDARADADVVRSLERLGAPPAPSAVEVVALPGFDDVPVAPTRRGRRAAAAVVRQSTLDGVVDEERTRIVTTSDADEEVRAAVRAIVDAARAGVSFDRMAVLSATPEPYARLAVEHLTAAGIPTNGNAVVPLTARLAPRALLQLLALPAGGYRRDEVFAWLTAAPVQWGPRPAPVAAWERLSRDAGVVAGDDWDSRLSALAAELQARADALELEVDPDTSRPVRSAKAVRVSAERAAGLRDFMLAWRRELAGAARPRGWREHATWARRVLDRIVGPPADRVEWPDVERKAAERLEVAIERLAALDELEEPIGLDLFTRTLTLELEADLGKVGRFGEGVLVGGISMGIGLDLDLVVLVGLAEGSLPAPVRDDSLLPDAERERCRGELDLMAGRVDRDHRHVLAALAGSRRQVLTIPRGDLRRSSERVPSRWAIDIASHLAGRQLWSADVLELTMPWLQHVASFDDGLRRADPPATAQEHRLRALLAKGSTGRGAEHLAAAAAGDATLAAGAAVVVARRSAEFTRFDGNLAGCDLPSPTAGVVSTSRLEAWASCPYAYLVRHVLSAEPVENPEDELEITPADKGTLIHAILERFIEEVLARPPAERPAPGTPWTAADRARMAAIAGEEFAEHERTGRTGRTVFWRRDQRRILADLQRILDHDDRHRREHGTRPLAAELAFGMRDATLPVVEVELPDGRVLQFRGKADRVDVDDEGRLHVVDYKTGSSKGYEHLSEEDPDKQGQKLQLPVYGRAARMLPAVDPDAPVRAEYWFASSKGGFKRYGYEITPAVVAKVGATLSAIADGIEAGVFPNRPSADSKPWVDCDACDPDGLGTADVRRAWERKRQDPALVAYATLAEPLEGIEPDVDDEGAGDRG